MTGTVFDIKEFAVYDGSGIRTTVFMKGCPLRCMWCHNPEGLRAQPEIMVSRAQCVHCGACERICPSPEKCIACGACVPVCPGNLRRIVGKEWTAEELATRLLKDKDVYDMSGGGVTFSGGEPLMQWEFVNEVVSLLGNTHKAVETSGYVSDEVFSQAMKAFDLVMLDWKAADDEVHRKYTGVSNESIKRHAKMLAAGDTPFILRMPIIPSVNDNRQHFITALELVRNAKSLVRVEVLPYRREAGAKYEMVSRRYATSFDETQAPRIYNEVFTEARVPCKVFK